MRLAHFPSAWDPRDEAFRRRTASVFLAIAIHVLLLLLLLRLAPPMPAPVAPAPKGITLDLLPDTKAETDRSEREAKEKQEKKRPAPAPAPRTPKLPKPVVQVPGPPAPSGSDIWSKVVPLTKQELAAVDTAVTRPSESTEEAQEGGGRSGERSASSAVVGTGPNGQPLYAAQWYRPPTSAQLAPYLPPGMRSIGWGMIICQTIEDYRVDNCQELDQSPAGSGLAGAVRQAAWQFRVIPPRIRGRALVGSWVRIRIEYTERGIR